MVLQLLSYVDGLVNLLMDTLTFVYLFASAANQGGANGYQDTPKAQQQLVLVVLQ
jgi:hypothetical protein